jgi:hypothetical protein
VNYALKKLMESRRLEKRSAGRGAFYHLVSLAVVRQTEVGEEIQCPICGGSGHLPILSKALSAGGVASVRGLRDELGCIECAETSYFTGVAGDRLVYRCLSGHAVSLTAEAAAKARREGAERGKAAAPASEETFDEDEEGLDDGAVPSYM